jgi:predicted Fe-Mo cluster-binding NifX family protein
MKVCISSTGTDMASPVDPRFGRAAYILLVDTENDEVRHLADATGMAHGAGVQAARKVIEARADALVTGQIGPNAFDVLSAAGVQIYLTSPTTVEQAIRNLTEGRLEEIGGPSSRPHAGMRA